MESRREKIRASLLVFLVAVSTREARWYRLRAKDANDEYSLSYLCGVPQKRFDKLLCEGDFLRAYGKGYRVLERDISLFLDASTSAVDIELVKSRVGGEKEFFLRIGAFGGSPHFTARDQFASGKIAHRRPHKAGDSFRLSLNEPSETTARTTVETTVEANKPHTEETAKGTIDGITKHHTNEITEPHTKETTVWNMSAIRLLPSFIKCHWGAHGVLVLY
jgi:hypothetical protein